MSQAAAAKAKRKYALQASNLKDALEVSALEAKVEELNTAQTALEAKIKSIEASFAEEKKAQGAEIASLREQLKSNSAAEEVRARL